MIKNLKNTKKRLELGMEKVKEELINNNVDKDVDVDFDIKKSK